MTLLYEIKYFYTTFEYEMNTPLLQIKNLTLAFPSENGSNEVVHTISFDLKKNEILGIVGESGSGKSVSSLAVLGLLPARTQIQGEVLFHTESGTIDLLKLKEKRFQNIRGNRIAMIFQEPMSSLNPSLTCGYQVLEIILQHNAISKKHAKAQVIDLFNKVKLPRAEQLYTQYPHQLSGGQKQRVMIAMAIACKPDVLIADEPTTALDVTVQKEIVLLLKALQEETQMSIVFITHDLALIAEIADKVLVMYKGNIVEQGTIATVFKNPQHNYTKALIHTKPSLKERLRTLPTISDFLRIDQFEKSIITASEREQEHKKLYAQQALLEVHNLATYFGKKSQVVKAVDDVSLKIYKGETLGLVGESGCGKTTLGRNIMGLEKVTKGTILYQGKDITRLNATQRKTLAQDIQIIFQDPYGSLNPKLMVGQAIMEPMQVHQLYKDAKTRKEKVLEILEKVGLERAHFYRYPHEFSGGQRQRIGIARTIALHPKIIICDESVSALDVSVQAQVLNLLNVLKNEFGFTYIFISHDLAVVKYMADQLVVMNKGKIEEMGDADVLYSKPQSAYTKQLIEAIPKGVVSKSRK